MILESYDKYEFKIIDYTILTPNRLVEKLNELGNEGWGVVLEFNNYSHTDSKRLLLQRKIIVSKYEK